MDEKEKTNFNKRQVNSDLGSLVTKTAGLIRERVCLVSRFAWNELPYMAQPNLKTAVRSGLGL